MADETPKVGHEIEVTRKRLCSVWWLLFWRGGVVGFGGGYAIATAVGFVVLSLAPGLPFPVAEIYGLVVGFIWLFPVYLWVTRSALRKQYKTFRIALNIALVPNVGPSSERRRSF